MEGIMGNTRSLSARSSPHGLPGGAVMAAVLVFSLVLLSGLDLAAQPKAEPARDVPNGALDYSPVGSEASRISGGYGHSTPLWMLPGRNGLTPEVSVVHTMASNGPLGAGFGLSLDRSIVRKGPEGGVARFGMVDTFWLGDQKLVSLSDGSYRTQVNDFTVYRPILTGGKIASWTAKRLGRTTTYGSKTGTSLACNEIEFQDEAVSTSGTASGTRPVRWLLSREADEFGNLINYNYVIPKVVTSTTEQSFQHQLTTIVYSLGTGATATIAFGWEARNDVRVSYADGQRRLVGQRLRRVVVRRTSGATNVAAYYLFLYEYGANNNASRLIEVRRLSIPDPLLSPTTSTEASWSYEWLNQFGYHSEATSWTPDVEQLVPVGDPGLPAGARGAVDTNTQLVDVNGDARPDLVLVNDSCTAINLDQRALELEELAGSEDGGGGGWGDPMPPPTESITATAYTCTPFHYVFLNQRDAAGEPEFVYSAELSDASYPSSLTSTLGAIHAADKAPLQWAILDLNRDGYADLVGEDFYALGSESGWIRQTPSCCFSAGELEGAQYADLDGDGFVDRFRHEYDYRITIELNTGVAPFFDGASLTASLPVTMDSIYGSDAWEEGVTHYGECMAKNTGDMLLAWQYGRDSDDRYSPAPARDPNPMDADAWAWMNTRVTDANSDGVADLVVSVPILVMVGPSEASSVPVFDYDASCGSYEAVLLGNGRGTFAAQSYGVAGRLDLTQIEQDYTDYGGGLTETIHYSYPANVVSFADVDGDGTVELTQRCASSTGSSGSVNALWDRGLVPAVSRVGFQLLPGSAGVPLCPTATAASSGLGSYLVAAPAEMFGSMLHGSIASTFADVDGDGDQDVVLARSPYDQTNWVTDFGALGADQYGVFVHRNQRSAAEGRLVSVRGPRGGYTSLEWDHSARGDNRIPQNVECLAALDGANGRWAFDYSDAGYFDGRFMGFGRVESRSPRGSLEVRTYATSLAYQGKLLTERLLGDGGNLKNLRVYLHGAPGSAALWASSVLAPYYHPVFRKCEYEFGQLNVTTRLGSRIDGYLEDCEDFSDEAGLLPWGSVANSTLVLAAATGTDPGALTSDPGLQAELEVVRAVANGVPYQVACGGEATQALDGSFHHALVFPGTQTCASLVNTGKFANLAGVAPRFNDLHLQPVPGEPQRLTVDSPVTGLEKPMSMQSILPADSQFRMFVDEFDYDGTKGRLIEERNLRDVSTTADSLVRDFTYSWQSSISDYALLKATVSSRMGKLYEDIRYSNFSRGQWRRKQQYQSSGPSRILEDRTFNTQGEVVTSTDPLGRVTTSTWGQCGLVSRVEPLGYSRSLSYDGACRLTNEDSFFTTTRIATKGFGYDGFRRVTRSETDPAPGVSVGATAGPGANCTSATSGKLARLVEETLHYGNSPLARLTFWTEPDGTVTQRRELVDGYDRLIADTTCQLVTGSTAYACVPGTEKTTLYGFSGTTGDLLATVGPYLSTDATQPAVYLWYDEFGRVKYRSEPGSGSFAWNQYEYSLGRRRVTDPLGHATTVTFDTLQEETGVDGISRGGAARDAFGLIVQRWDGEGNTSTLAYDGFNRLASESLPEVDVLASGATTAVRGRPTSSYAYLANDKLQVKTDPDGSTTRYTYDVGDRLLQVTGTDGVITEKRSYLDGGFGTRAVVVSDAVLHTRYEYQDGLGRLTSQVATDGALSVYAWDSRGRQAQQTLPWGEERCTRFSNAGLTRQDTSVRGGVTAVTTVTLSARGNPVISTDADGAQETFAYDPAGRLTTRRVGSGAGYLAAENSYDDNGWLAETRTNGVLTRYTRDAAGRVVTEEVGYDAAAGNALVTNQWTYYDNDRLATSQDGEGSVVSYTWDGAGRLVSRSLTPAGEPSYAPTTYEYDANGNQTRSIDPEGVQVDREYDGYDRLVVETPAGLGPIVHSYEPSSPSVTPHDLLTASPAFVESVTLPTGEVSRRYLDGEGRAYLVCDAARVCVLTSYTDGLPASRARYGYSVATGRHSHAATQYLEYQPGSDLPYREWEWIDPADEPSLCPGSVPDSCNWAKVTRAHTPAGRLQSVTDAAGNATTLGYAADGSGLVADVDFDGLGSVSYHYDATYPVRTGVTRTGTDGASTITTSLVLQRYLRAEAFTRSDGITTEAGRYEYDPNGRLSLSELTRGSDGVTIEQEWDAQGGLARRDYAVTVGGATHLGHLAWTWRHNGQLASLAYPSGSAVQYTYDPASGLLESITTASGSVMSIPMASRDASGRALAMAFGTTPVSLERAYDPFGRESHRKLVDGTTTRDEDFTWDRVGRLEDVHATENGTGSLVSFGYDARDFLLNEDHGGFSVAYAYDDLTGLPTGRSTVSGAGEVLSYSFGTGNRMTDLTSDVTGHASLGWDAFGRQTRDRWGRTYSYGPADQVLGIADGASILEQNLHDAAGVRVARVVGPSTELFFSGAGPDEILEAVEADGSTHDYVRLPGGGVIGVLDSSGAVLPVVRDIRGNPVRMGSSTSDSRQVEYSAFGEEIWSLGSLDDDLGFHQMLDTEASGVLLAGVRAYDSATGRFLTPDPLLFASSADVNDAADFYRYARHNPVAYQDPTGYMTSPIATYQGADGGAPGNLSGMGMALPDTPKGKPVNIFKRKVANEDATVVVQGTVTLNSDGSITITERTTVEATSSDAGGASDASGDTMAQALGELVAIRSGDGRTFAMAPPAATKTEAATPTSPTASPAAGEQKSGPATVATSSGGEATKGGSPDSGAGKTADKAAPARQRPAPTGPAIPAPKASTGHTAQATARPEAKPTPRPAAVPAGAAGPAQAGPPVAPSSSGGSSPLDRLLDGIQPELAIEIGVGVMGFLGGGGSGQAALVADTHGNVGIELTGAGIIGVPANGSIALPSITLTKGADGDNPHTIMNLNGNANRVGVAGGELFTGGFEAVRGSGGTYYGVGYSTGPGLHIPDMPFSAYVTFDHTRVVPLFNVVDVVVDAFLNYPADPIPGLPPGH
jgi:RHS repeat-associated protein